MSQIIQQKYADKISNLVTVGSKYNEEDETEPAQSEEDQKEESKEQVQKKKIAKITSLNKDDTDEEEDE